MVKLKESRILSIIPARGGSKGIRKKNIKELNGKPLIVWTINTAISSMHVDRVIVSTDDKETADISKRFYAEVPFIRPSALATDGASTISVIEHTLKWLLENQSYKSEAVLLLQPTSPLRTVDDIDSAVRLFRQNHTRAVVSVSESETHPWLCNTLPEDNNMSEFLRPEVINKRRQDFPPYYQVNGAIYLAEIDYLFMQKGFMGPQTYAYVMPKDRSIDIDTPSDFEYAEFLLSKH